MSPPPTYVRSYVPLRKVTQLYIENEKNVFHATREYQRVFQAVKACRGQVPPNIVQMWMNETWRVIHVLGINQHMMTAWLQKDSDRTLLIEMVFIWLDHTQVLFQKHRPLFMCMMKELSKPNTFCTLLDRGPLRQLVTVLDSVHKKVESYTTLVQNALPHLPSILGELESNCGVKKENGWMEPVKTVLRQLHHTVPTPVSVSEPFSSAPDSCPKCARSCAECTHCQGWSVMTRFLVFLVAAIVGFAVCYAVNAE